MKTDLIAKAGVTINASKDEVWDALVDPAKIKKYMFGSDAKSDFRQGSKVLFTGEWKGKPFEEKGTILKAEPGKVLSYNTYSPQSGKPDTEDNYHTVTIELSEKNDQTEVSLSQDNNESEEMCENSRKNWEGMLGELKKVVEEKQ